MKDFCSKYAENFWSRGGPNCPWGGGSNFLEWKEDRHWWGEDSPPIPPCWAALGSCKIRAANQQIGQIFKLFQRARKYKCMYKHMWHHDGKVGGGHSGLWGIGRWYLSYKYEIFENGLNVCWFLRYQILNLLNIGTVWNAQHRDSPYI